MRANNLTISIPSPRCTKNCPFCISRMTVPVEDNTQIFEYNMQKVKTVAGMAQVSSVLITSKNEPMDNLFMINKVAEEFKEYPVELQTNGLALKEHPELIDGLSHNINIIAISIDGPEQLKLFEDTLSALDDVGYVIRLTLVMSDRWNNMQLGDIIHFCKENYVSQLTLRIPSIPKRMIESIETTNIVKWITEHNVGYDHILDILDVLKTKENLVRELPFGAAVYDISGIGVTTMDYCIQENSNSEDIRSLIYQADGHLYTTWDKKGSIIF